MTGEERRQRARSGPSIDRLPPHSMEAEQAVLGCCIMDPVNCLNTCVAKFGTSEARVFYDLRHQEIYSALLGMSVNAEPIDLITLMQRLKDKQKLDQVGGMAYLATLPDVVPSTANLPTYLEVITEKYLLRNLVRECTDIVSHVYDSEDQAENIVDDAERRILSVRQFTKFDVDPGMNETVKKVICTIERLHERKGAGFGVPTGFADLDRMTGGLVNSEMIVLAARPSIGKTSLAMNIAEHVALNLKLPVGVFSLETTREILVMRMMCSRARVDLTLIRDGGLGERDFQKLTGVAGNLAKAPIYIDDSAGLTALELRAKARRMYQQYAIRFLVIDYLQLLKAMINGRRIDKREREVAEVSDSVKVLAKELGIPVIVIAQLSREVEKQKRRPNLSDLRESGAIEADADQVWLLHKKLKNEDDGDEDRDVTGMDLIIAKQKNGPTGSVPLTFFKCFTRFESASKISDEGLPEESRLPHMD